MWHRPFRFVGTLLPILALASAARAAVPRTIPFQCTLRTTQGAPATGDVQFALYDAPVGGYALWLEVHTITSPGVVSVRLGSVVPLPLALRFDRPYWVGVTVGNDPEMTPRLPLGAVPYALSLPNVSVSPVSGNVGIGTPDPPSLLTVRADYAGTTPDARQVLVQGGTDPAQQLELGYNTSLDIGTIQAVHQGVATTPLLLQPGGGDVGIGGVETGYRLTVRGAIVADRFVTASDIRFKTNVEPIRDALDTVTALRGVTFDWRPSAFPDRDFPAGRQVGFIAQEVEQTLPEVVTTGADGYKAVAYQNIVPVLVEAVKALDADNKSKSAQIAALKDDYDQRLAALEARLDRLESAR